MSIDEFTWNRKLPSGGFAYGILVNALIGRPLYDLRYLPINLFPFVNVIRKSFDVIVQTEPNVHKITSETKIRRHILANTVRIYCKYGLRIFITFRFYFKFVTINSSVENEMNFWSLENTRISATALTCTVVKCWTVVWLQITKNLNWRKSISWTCRLESLVFRKNFGFTIDCFEFFFFWSIEITLSWNAEQHEKSQHFWR